MKGADDARSGRGLKLKIKSPATVNDTFDLPVSDEHMPFDVVGFGLNSMDHLCVVPEYPERDAKKEMVRYEQRAGGQVATALAFLSRMGMKTKYVGKLGDDDSGRECLRELEKSGIDTTSVVTAHGARNQFSVIIIDQRSGERTVLTRRDPGLDMREAELDEKSLCCGRITHMDGYDPASLKAAQLCRRHGIPVCLDLDAAVPGWRQLLASADVLIVSSHFPRIVTGIPDPVEAFRSLRKYCSGFVAMTRGADGAMALVGNRCVTFPGLRVNAVDTTGAGDVFHGAFLYGLLENWPLNRIMAFANAAAGLSCLHLGAQAGIRPLSEILMCMEPLIIR